MADCPWLSLEFIGTVNSIDQRRSASPGIDTPCLTTMTVARPGTPLHLNAFDFRTRGCRLASANHIRCRPCEIFSARNRQRSEEHTSELQSLMRISYAVFCLKKKNKNTK